jgi:hypothetical protein
MADLEVSVVIPSYNRADLIEETLESVWNQTLPPREVIVVDDGSTDNTEEVVNRFRPRVRYHRIQNAGPPQARNIGVSLAQCPWIALCDSDDLWTPGKLRHQARVAAYGVEYVFSDFQLVVDGHWEQSRKFESLPAGWWPAASREPEPGIRILEEPLYEKLLRLTPVFQSTIMMTRRMFHHVGGFNPSFGRGLSEDFEFTLRCVQESPLGVSMESLAGIRKHAGGRSTNTMGSLMGSAAILRHSMEHHRLGPLHAATILDEISRRSSEAAHLAFAGQRLDLVRQLYPDVGSQHDSMKLRIKRAVAALPEPLGGMLCRSMLSLSDRRRP